MPEVIAVAWTLLVALSLAVAAGCGSSDGEPTTTAETRSEPERDAGDDGGPDAAPPPERRSGGGGDWAGD